MRAYHYVTKGNNVLQKGLMSFSKSPNVDLNYYTKRSHKRTQKGISQWMDSIFPGYSRGVRCFAEPIQWTEKSINLKRLIDQSDMFSIDVNRLSKDGLLEAIYFHVPLANKGQKAIEKALKKIEQEGKDGFRKILLKDFGKIKANWNLCDESLGHRFAFIPFYLLIMKEGVIPPKYLKKIKHKKQKGSKMVQEIEKRRDYFEFYEKQVLPKVRELATQKDQGFHGLYTHTDAVVFRGIDYALMLNKDPIPVIFACACHDAAKDQDGYNEHHGRDALPIAKKVMRQFPDLLNKETQDRILYAIENHTTGKDAPDYVSACLWDADRTRLAWIRGYHPHFFTTDYAKEVASGSAKKYVEYMNHCLGRPKADDREESVALSLQHFASLMNAPQSR